MEPREPDEEQRIEEAEREDEQSPEQLEEGEGDVLTPEGR